MELDLDDPCLLLRDDVLADPRPLYDLLRREAPVWQLPGQDTFLVADPAVVRAAVGRPEDLSSNLVSLLHDDGHGCPVPFALAPFGDPIHVLATADPPVHTRHRRLLQPHLSPSAVAELEPAMARIVDEHLVDLAVGGTVDAVAAFSDPVPAHTICEVLGLPAGDWPEVLRHTYAVGPLLDGIADAEGMGEALGAAMRLSTYVQARLDEALAAPAAARRGLLAALAAGVAEGTATRAEARAMLVVLVTAGSETTASLIATAVEALAADPGLQDRLRRAPEGIPDVLEDLLRTDGPFQLHYRYAPADTELGGVAIPAGSRVLLLWAAANRPPPDAGPPDGGDGRRGPAPHLAFGRGLHFCIGAPLARVEARIAVERLLAATRSFRLDPAQRPTRRPSISIHRHAELPIVVEPT